MQLAKDTHREWELDGQLHRTEEDATRVVRHGLMGALVAGSDVYLMALRAQLLEVVGHIDERLAEFPPPCDCTGPNEHGIHEDSCATVVY